MGLVAEGDGERAGFLLLHPNEITPKVSVFQQSLTLKVYVSQECWKGSAGQLWSTFFHAISVKCS